MGEAAPESAFGVDGPSSAGSTTASAPSTARILADVNHELGNYFHKLYYWGDAVCDLAAGNPPDGIPPELLGQTLRNLERFLRTAFAHFEPIDLASIDMPIGDVMAAIAQRLRAGLPGVVVDAEGADAAGGRLALDPGRISNAVEVVAVRCRERIGPQGTVRLTTERPTASAITFRFAVTDAKRPAAPTISSSLEWLKAQQVVALHGGSLSEADRTDGSWIVTMQFPL